MTRSSRFAVVALCVLGIGGVNGDDVNKFTYPAQDGLKYNYRDTILTSYEGNITSPVMYTFCQNSEGNVEQELYNHVNGPNTTAAILLDFTVDKSVTSCWFNIRLDETGSSVGANSANFQYNSTEGERKTYSLAPTSTSTSGSPTATSTTNPAIASTSASTASASASASNSSGLSTGASAGVGVGVGLVGVALGAAAVFFCYRRRKKRGVVDDSNEKGGAGGPGGPDGPDVSSAPSELMGSSQYPPSAGVPPSTKAGYYAPVPNSEIHEAPAFQDGVQKAELATPFVPYKDAGAGVQQQKFHDTPSIAPTQEMEDTSVVHEMP
ncbi:hypothetical protein F5B19DRAFT_500037 [Rostrohypoxylon terebratum]|nr:hypothetical protein F5B19DRAFT_500037 [Rostrohypoxylon terebratum]